MREFYKSLERTAYKAAWGLTLALGMSCTNREQEVKILAPEPVKEAQPVSERPVYQQPSQVQTTEPIQEPPVQIGRRDPLENAPLEVKLGFASRQLYSVVRKSKAYREGGLEEKKLELAEVRGFTTRVGAYRAGTLNDEEGEQLLEEIKFYIREIMLEDRRREAKGE